MSFILIIIYQKFNMVVHGIPIGGYSWAQIWGNRTFIIIWSILGASLYYFVFNEIRKKKIVDTIEAEKRIVEREKYYSESNTHECRVCGCYSDDFPWGEDGKSPSFQICPCCGVQFGKEDVTLESIKQYRAEWISKGGKWFDKDEKPDSWDMEIQMKNIPDKFM